MTMTRAEAAAWLLANDGYTLVTHRRPDGDTVGSAAALCLGLRALGKTAHILKNQEVTPKYRHLHEGLTKDAAEEGDLLISVDVASPNMLPDAFRHLQGAISLRIDHHGTATPFTPLELVEPEAAACAEIIYEVLIELGVTLDKPMAEALYTATATDTGCFRYANTNAHSYLVAAACAQAGGDLFAINQAIFETNSFRKLKIQSWITENTKFYRGGTVAVCALPLSVEQEIGVTEDDMENISGFPRSIEGVKLAATLRQTGDLVKISLRCAPGFDAGAICARFGGGGHAGAAGCSMKLPMAEAAQAITQALLTA